MGITLPVHRNYRAIRKMQRPSRSCVLYRTQQRATELLQLPAIALTLREPLCRSLEHAWKVDVPTNIVRVFHLHR